MVLSAKILFCANTAKIGCLLGTNIKREFRRTLIVSFHFYAFWINKLCIYKAISPPAHVLPDTRFLHSKRHLRQTSAIKLCISMIQNCSNVAY